MNADKNADRDNVTMVEENGSFRLLACHGRYTVVEARGGRLYGVPRDGEGGRPGGPDGAADDADGLEIVARWTGEAAARGLLADLAARGDQLARKLR